MIRLLLIATVALVGCATLDEDERATICSIWNGQTPEGQEVEVEGYLYTNWRGFIAIASRNAPKRFCPSSSRKPLKLIATVPGQRHYR